MKPMNYASGERHCRPHSIAVLPHEDLFAARRRWRAAKPAGCVSPIFLD